MKTPKLQASEDKILDEYLAGKSHLSDAYKNIATDLPSLEIDSAILAASRREVHSRPHAAGASRWHKWQMPLSIAAVLVISASLTLTMTEHQKQSDEVSLMSAPVVLQEEAKASRGDSLGQNETAKADAKPSAAAAASAPARRLEPPEKTKKMASAVIPEPKPAQVKSAQAGASPQADNQLPRYKGETKAQAFPPASAKGQLAGVVATTQAESGSIGQAASAKAEVITAVTADKANVADASLARAPAPAPVVAAAAKPAPMPAAVAAPPPAPAPMPAAPVAAAVADAGEPAQMKSSTEISTAARSRSNTNTNTKYTAEDSVNAPKILNKSAPLNETSTVAAYSAAQTWLAKIEALLREGKTDEAEQSLAEFKKRFPNYVTPESIKNEIEKQRAALTGEQNK